MKKLPFAFPSILSSLAALPSLANTGSYNPWPVSSNSWAPINSWQAVAPIVEQAASWPAAAPVAAINNYESAWPSTSGSEASYPAPASYPSAAASYPSAPAGYSEQAKSANGAYGPVSSVSGGYGQEQQEQQVEQKPSSNGSY